MRRAFLTGTVMAAVAALSSCRSMPPDATSSAAKGTIEGTVVVVVDGDTLDVQTRNGRERVRLLGIDAPEVAHEKPGQCGADDALASLERLAYHKQVSVQADAKADERDRYGRLLAYVSDGSTDLGRVQVERGYAEAWHPRATTPPVRFKQYAYAAEQARARRAGAWATCLSPGR
ncbi:thermonuclease family protein [Corynebacterium variabile]|uniref:thermonuclease family protein n=1 Tax=Corynebacterium variabile TaxID=1727 RepID=UPI002FE1DF11